MAKGVNMASINAKIQRAVDSALANEVANDVKQKLSDAVVYTVYEVEEPAVYSRREKGGLSDMKTMGSNVAGGVLTVSPNAKPKGLWIDMETGKTKKSYGDGYDTSKSLAYNINYGYNKKKAWYDKPRQFVYNAEATVLHTQSAVAALTLGLVSRIGSFAEVTANFATWRQKTHTLDEKLSIVRATKLKYEQSRAQARDLTRDSYTYNPNWRNH